MQVIISDSDDNLKVKFPNESLVSYEERLIKLEKQVAELQEIMKALPYTRFK